MNYSEVLNRMKFLTALFLCSALSSALIMSCSSLAENTTASSLVTIIDSKDNKQRLISDAKQLNRFHYFWSQKQPVLQEQPFHWRYQITIKGPGGSSRWVYDPKGFAGEISLSKSKVIYRLNPIRSFNRFLMEE